MTIEQELAEIIYLVVAGRIILATISPGDEVLRAHSASEEIAKAILASGLVIPLSGLDEMVEKVARVVHKVDDLGDRIPFDSMSLIGVKQRQIYTYLAQAAINAIKEEAGKL